jgi:hypothetical protein
MGGRAPTGYLLGVPTDLGSVLPILLPILLLELLLLVLGLRDLLRPERRVRGDSKVLWAVVIVFVGIFGPLIYFAVGRTDS